jgi:2-iminobutanoate/2-iminopropanoate deaminase
MGVPSDSSNPNSTTRSIRRHIQLDPAYPFSDAVLVGDTLYMSGRIGLDESRSKVPEDISAEARNIMEDVKSVLGKAGMQVDDLVYVQIFCSDMSLRDRFNEVYCSYFNGGLPARAFIGSAKLLFDAHFEVQAIAIKQPK